VAGHADSGRPESEASGGPRSAAAAHVPRAAAAEEGNARTGVPELQRARILAALVEVARERGAAGITVARIVTRSGVSRRTFYEQFEDRNACFLAAFEEAIARATARVAPAAQDGGSWRERMRRGLLALLEFLDDEPEMGALCVVDALGAGSVALARRAQVLAALIDAVDGGRREARAGLHPTRISAEGVVGGVLSVLYTRLAEPEPEPEPGQGPTVALLNPLMATLVLPYLGHEVAAQEAARAAPAPRRRTPRTPSNPLEGLQMRLTYRTVRVLMAIADVPQASNRRVADTAGVQDQGQISKLLTRLEHLGLIQNTGSGQSRGEPNAWQLTAKGHDVELAIRQQTVATD
jgi:AcrR family transcriptional regulator